MFARHMRLRKWLQIIVSLSLLAALIGSLNFSQAREIIEQVEIIFLPLIFVVFAADRVLMAWKWSILLDAIYEKLRFFDYVRIYYVSSFIGIALPFGGLGPDIVRFVQVRANDVPADRAMVSIVMERLLGLLSTMLTVLIALIVFLQLLRHDASRAAFVVTGIPLALVAVGGSLVVLHDEARGRVIRLLRLRNIATRLRIGRYYEVFSEYKRHKPRLYLFYFLSIVEQFFPILSFYLASRALSSPITLLQCLAVVPITSVFQRLPISVAGIGVREGAYVALLGLLGVQFSYALLVSAFAFLMFMVSLLPGGIWALMSGFRRPSPETLDPVRSSEP